MNNKKYDLFIAYHGTFSENGSYEVAKQLCDYLSSDENGFTVYLHGYSCLPEHKDIQWNRTWEIVDECQCMIAVVNDYAPKNHNGRLGNEIGEAESQIRAEVDAFYDLINRNMRDRHDFNFFYAGKTLYGEDQINSFRELHSQIINGHNSLINYSRENENNKFAYVKDWLTQRGCSADDETKQLKKLRELLEGLGWGKSILFSPKELLTYEKKISRDLSSLTLIAANTTDDVKGGAIFPLVEENLKRGVEYTYLFFEYPGAKKQLENIYQSHLPELRDKLHIKYVKSNAWFAADVLLVKIYEFKGDQRPEIFFRIKMSTDNHAEQCIYIKGDYNKIPIIQQELDSILEDLKVLTYDENGWK